MPITTILTKKAEDKARGLRLLTRLNQKLEFFRTNIRYPSLRFELLQPKQLGLYSIRINDQYRAILIKSKEEEYTIIDVTDYH